MRQYKPSHPWRVVVLYPIVIEPEEMAGEQARQLIALARQQLTDADVQRNLINLIETIIVYKLPHKSREEIAALLNLSELKKTRFYQKVKQEGVEEGREEGERQAKIAAIPRMMTFGLNAETIAEILDLPAEFVQNTITQIQRKAMSFSEQNIDTFIEVLTQQRSIFSKGSISRISSPNRAFSRRS